MSRAAAVVPVALAAALGACGGGSGPAAAPPATVTVERTTVALAPGASGRPATFDPRAIYERVAPGVVTVVALYGDGGVFGGSRGAEGSGFVLSERGEIATNAHVVTQGRGATIRPVAKVYVRFTDRNQVSARIVGFDPNEDVALLRVDPRGLRLRPLELGSSSNLAVGTPVAAIGSPFGEEGSLSTGIVSAIDRTIESLTRFQIAGAIQTDAAINHGNSGGPLVDWRGRVLGINSQINSSSGDNSGVGFAVPIDSVRRSLAQLREKGRVDYAYLGVSTAGLYPQLARQLGLPVDAGALVAQVIPGGPADRAGLRAGRQRLRFQGDEVPRGSDVIVGVGGRPVRLADDLGRILEDLRPGQRVDLQIVRDGRRQTVAVTLGKRPAEARP